MLRSRMRSNDVATFDLANLVARVFKGHAIVMMLVGGEPKDEAKSD